MDRFCRGVPVPLTDAQKRAQFLAARQKSVSMLQAATGLKEPTFEAFCDWLDREVCRGTIWKNSLYQVTVYPPKDNEELVGLGWPRMIHLSIRRNDRKPINDWRHMQEIKNQLVGPENEAVELYPAESRLVDSANQYHLWVIEDEGIRFPFGFGERFTGDESVGGAVQRPGADRPID